MLTEKTDTSHVMNELQAEHEETDANGTVVERRKFGRPGTEQEANMESTVIACCIRKKSFIN